MNSFILLRVCALISLLFAAGHGRGGRKDWSPMGETDVLKAMRSVRFDTMGVSRSYLDFYRGFGHSLTVFLLLQAAVLWLLAGLSNSDPAAVRPIIAVFAVASLASGAISWRFLFPVPAVFSLILTVGLVIAFALAG